MIGVLQALIQIELYFATLFRVTTNIRICTTKFYSVGCHYNDVTMVAMVSPVTSNSTVDTIIYLS